MKPYVLLFIGPLFLVVYPGWSQCSCCSNPVQSSVVTKPADAGIIATTCSTLVISWRGIVSQTYIIQGISTNPLTNLSATTDPALNITGDDNFNYTATIPVEAGTRVRFNIVAMSVIDNRTFISYPLRNEVEYFIPNCSEVMVNTGSSERSKQNVNLAASVVPKEELIIVNRELAMYPNPITDILNIRWKSEYTGRAKVSIMDMSGQVIKTLDVKKEQFSYLNAVSVNTLPAGVYILYLKMQNGKSLVSRFLKE